MSQRDAIAIVGLGGVFPGARNPEAFWENIEAGRTLSREAPPERWLLSMDDAYDPRVGALDRVYSKKACFVEKDAFDLERDLLGPMASCGEDARVAPDLLRALDPLYHLLLHAGRQAFHDAGAAGWDTARMGLIVGNLALPTTKSSALAWEILGRTFEEKVTGESTPVEATHPLNRYVTGLPAGILAKALDLGGICHTIDAACASGLYALKLAADELLAGRADAMLAGGVARPDSLYAQMGFSQLRALSPTGTCAPFDAKGDGLVVGEGAGVFVLKRLSDAVRDGDTIHAVLRGMGLSNDVGGRLLAPTSEGQLRAMRAAYTAAGWRPAEVDHIECHATGTPVGDAVEFESLRQLWAGVPEPGRKCVLGSVKSNMGHLLTAAGAAAMMKTVLALKHGQLPPTANFQQSPPDWGMEESPFRVLAEAEPWDRRTPDSARRAAVSAFGFGGINAHVLVEEWLAPAREAATVEVETPESPAEVAVVGLAAHVGPWDSLAALQERLFGGDSTTAPTAPENWWGVERSGWLRRSPHGRRALRGYFVDALNVPLKQFRIPPKELEEMLPQQLIMLSVAAAAWDDAGMAVEENLRAGAYIGLGLDLNTTNFHVRWAVRHLADRWAEELGAALTHEQREAWIDILRDAAGPPLTANRTMGALGSVAASRIARELRLGGPSFALSSERGSGISALNAAVRALQTGGVDVALAGAVDLAGDVRAALAAAEIEEGTDTTIGEGAAALVLKRLTDAERDGDRIYGVIDGLSVTREGYSPAVETEAGSAALLVGEEGACNPRTRLGRTGAAEAMVSMASALLCLHHETLPPGPNGEPAQHWLHDRAAGPRQAVVAAATMEGGRAHVSLKESPGKAAMQREATGLQPLGEHPEALFGLWSDTAAGLLAELESLAAMASGAASVEAVARSWWQARREQTRGSLAAALVARAAGELLDQIALLQDWLKEDASRPLNANRGPGQREFERDRIFYSPTPLAKQGKVAFVFPGSGNHFADMGREILARFPEVARRQDGENLHLRAQYRPDFFWGRETLENEEDDHEALIFGQVALGTAMSDLARAFGIEPESVIGYSLGETAGLFSLRAWRDRDGMLDRINHSDLFTTKLAGDCDAARMRWGLPKHEAVDWVLGVIDRPMQVAKGALKNYKKVYPLIANTLQESVVGGNRKAVEKLIHNLECQFIPLRGVTTVHCEVVKEVEEDYRNLHLFETTPPKGVRFYSGAWGRAYPVDREKAADSILAQAVEGVDFPAVVEAAHGAGTRIFIELGPGNSCSRMISKILTGEPHLARSLCQPGQEPVSLLLRGLANCIAEGVAVDLDPLYGHDQWTAPEKRRGPSISVVPGGAPFHAPKPAHREPAPKPRAARAVTPAPSPRPAPAPSPVPAPQPANALMPAAPAAVGASALVAGLEAAEAAQAAAHAQYLAFAEQMTQAMTQAIALQMAAPPGTAVSPTPARTDVAYGRDACMEFAIGRIGTMLGPEYSEIDSYPTRVRLPDEPLMLVDRIVLVEGGRLSMQPGRVVTEHDVLEGAWYLDGGRIPTCIAVEAGQADLFLSGYLGIDLQTKGLSMYRLLDAEVTFHRGLPKPGDVIRYDIHIERFFRHGNPWFFNFHFDGTVNGEKLITMRKGCAGFFSRTELDAGEGIVTPKIERMPQPGVRPEDWKALAPMAHGRYDEAQLNCLRGGDLAGCFGEAFAGLALKDPMRLPDGRMRLVHRVSAIEPEGGRYGLGLIRAEADIHPDDWFITCHFVDDRVMPGTLMYECCMHTLRVFLMRMGWVGEHGEVVCEPIVGVVSRLKCRGQVLETTKVVTYEVSIRELGYNPAPYAIADAKMYSDGKPIVDITNMAVQFTGLDRAKVEELWEGRAAAAFGPKPAVFDYGHILEFAQGSPSAAFGEPYRVFDSGRVMARLPRPPYDAITRITAVDTAPWILRGNTNVEAQYDVPRDAWYFAADRQPFVPYAMLLEVGLQPCGWLAAYMGAALTSEETLKFRNLGGTCTQHRPVPADAGLLHTRAKCTGVSQSGGMIILNYEMAIEGPEGLVYSGATYFGFFTEASLADQVGVREYVPYAPSGEELAQAEAMAFPDGEPYPDARWRMVDRVTAFAPAGGPAGLGFIRGEMEVDPEAWFFKAHFYQDPVCPGSMGLESFLQLLKVVAARRWNLGGDARFLCTAPGVEHEWIYRGQIVPTSKRVTVEAVVTEADDAKGLLRADGCLMVDGMVIYVLKNFSVCVGA